MMWLVRFLPALVVAAFLLFAAARDLGLVASWWTVAAGTIGSAQVLILAWIFWLGLREVWRAVRNRRR